ncbi:interleukin-1 receptor-associated kinase 4 isoform X2 [Diabrotica virgifera virgifera]|uniref:non-specific serine/threonine protein kinase n=1 Tax=Diabrotica virgifera virgifera TaxID=50390 RepID=A0ABM5KM83_DIAVI|nr:interleukin-1 receptor-associated kinase 4 isoform X2 [Diabrotica virgifera virgifera]
MSEILLEPSLEIRKLRPSQIRELSSILETHELWKRLMSIIPKTLEKTNYKCDLTTHNPHKYTAEHFRYSDKTPKKVNKIPDIVITPDVEENRVPAFQTPIVTVRPKEPEVQEDVSDMIKFSTTQIQNSTVTEMDSQEIPAVVNIINSENVSEPQEMNMPNLSMIMNSNSNNSSTSNNESTVDNSASSISNTMSESYSQSSVQSESSVTDSYSPAFSQILGPTIQPETTGENVPNLSVLNLQPEGSDSEVNVEANETTSEANMMPDLDLLQQQSEVITDSNNLPDFNTLQVSNTASQSIQLSTASQVSSESSTKTRSCSSPLPNLSLDTVLPHYSYQNLETATNYFNESKYMGQKYEGRFLGSGEFGSVFLALGLLNKPIAVKKLFIGDVEVVDIDDEVTKQFRTEVEVLSKYKHDNLLSLLGYSCDGSTYCLLYDYIPGGPLKDRLQNISNILSWKQRLNIAMGTSRAIAYLHTAFPTPLLHRDIKSANILLDSRGQPKLGDFGLIKLMTNQNINTSTTVFGTSAYMPPEAFGGDESVQFDTFSFGVVVLELLTSLPAIDNDREGTDLVTHIAETIENDDISVVVDYRAGTWKENNVDYAMKFYKISQSCLEEKIRRPTMVQIKTALDDLMKDIR